jgi:hypothetical protein
MMKKLKIVIASSALVLGGFAGVAAAKGHGGPRKGAMLEKFDLDKNGTLDEAEKAKAKEAFAAKRAERKQRVLAQYDTNRDGKLDDAEKQAMRDARVAERFAQLDTNRDGKISLDEFKAGNKGRHGPGLHGKRGMGKPGGAAR